MDQNLQALKCLPEFGRDISLSSKNDILWIVIDGDCYILFHALLHFRLDDIASMSTHNRLILVERAIETSGGILFLILLTHGPNPGQSSGWTREILSIGERWASKQSPDLRRKRIKAANATSLERAQITKGCIEILKTMISSGQIRANPRPGYKESNWWKVLIGEAIEV
jgi:hypothetical protein